MMPLDEARLRVSRGLESGAWDGAVPRALSRVWSAVASRGLARPLSWPEGTRVIAVGGATLGGSGKTPLAIACARTLARDGGRVAFVAHGYRARPGAPRVVREDDDVAVVGDEALVAARALGGAAPVIVAPTRQAAIELASSLADTLLLDGVLQTTPRRVSLSLLALDGLSPWGSGRVPPRGDLRAPRHALLAHADHAVLLRDALDPDAPPSDSTTAALFGALDRTSHVARVVSRGVHLSGRLVPWSELAPLRVGLFTALARPSRVVASLARRGVTPAVVVDSSDHARPPPGSLARRLAGAPVDLWVATPKCATHLDADRIPHATLDHVVILGDSLIWLLEAGRHDPPARVHDAPSRTLP